MNKSRQNVNNGIRTIAKRNWEREQAMLKAERDAKVKAANAAFAATLKGK